MSCHDFLIKVITLALYRLTFADWGPKIDVVGFCFLDLATGYEPPEALVNWLKAGPKPIYIGFGSLVSFLEPCCFSL